MEVKPKQKAKRIIKDLDFSGEGCAVSLVGPSVGSAANGKTTLIFKSNVQPSTEDKESKPVVESTVEGTSFEVNEGVSPVVKQNNKENKMEEKETVEALQKSLNDQKELLQKALEQIKAFEVEKKEAITKSRKAEVVAAVKDADKAEVLFKAVAEASDEDFKAIVKALSDLTAAVEKTDLFIEKGVQVEEKPAVQVNHVEALLKAKYAAGK